MITVEAIVNPLWQISSFATIDNYLLSVHTGDEKNSHQ